MLTSYIHAALRRAKYEIIEDGQYYGEIPGFDGIWASAATLEECRDELRETLEDWLVLGFGWGMCFRSWMASISSRLRRHNGRFGTQ